MSEFVQASLLLGLGALVGYLLAYRFMRRDFDAVNRRLDELRIEIRQLPTIEISAPVDLTPITTMIKTLEIRVGALSQRLTDSPRRNIGQDKPKLLRTDVFRKKDDPLT